MPALRYSTQSNRGQGRLRAVIAGTAGDKIPARVVTVTVRPGARDRIGAEEPVDDSSRSNLDIIKLVLVPVPFN